MFTEVVQPRFREMNPAGHLGFTVLPSGFEKVAEQVYRTGYYKHDAETIFRTWLNSHVLPAFEGRILPVDLQNAKLHVPDPHPIRDGLIAATALVHGMAVVTRNVDDFKRTGVPILNPWETD